MSDALGLACEHGMLARCCEVCELRADRDRLTAELTDEKQLHALAKAFHAVAVSQRNAAWAENERLRDQLAAEKETTITGTRAELHTLVASQRTAAWAENERLKEELAAEKKALEEKTEAFKRNMQPDWSK